MRRREEREREEEGRVGRETKGREDGEVGVRIDTAREVGGREFMKRGRGGHAGAGWGMRMRRRRRTGKERGREGGQDLRREARVWKEGRLDVEGVVE